MTDEVPIAYRVWWEHHSAKLHSNKPPKPEFRDFGSEQDAMAFKRKQRERFPHSVFCIAPRYHTSDAGIPRGNRRRPR